MRESTGDGKVLKHSGDPGLGYLQAYIPEYNLRDITSKPEHFLNLFKFRATTEPHHQLYEGTNGQCGDRELIECSGCGYPHLSKDEWTMFVPGEHYGQSMRGTGAHDTRELEAMSERYGGAMVQRPQGERILRRQAFILQFLNHLVEGLLDLGSKARAKETPPRKATET